MRVTMIGAILSTVFVWPTIAQAHIVIGFGEKITQVSELPAELQEALTNEDVAVGFLYERLHICYCSIWTWNGRFVLFRGNEYWALTDVEFVELLGQEQFRALSKPLGYRFPAVPVAIVAFIALRLAYQRLFPSASARARRLQKDPTYQKAFQLYADRLAKSADRATDESHAFAAAIDYLYSQGESVDNAEARLRLLLQETPQPLRLRIKHVSSELMNQAIKLEQSGDWEQAIRAYENLSTVPGTPDRDHALQRITELKYKLNRVNESDRN
jgi:hypothetical protein